MLAETAGLKVKVTNPGINPSQLALPVANVLSKKASISYLIMAWVVPVFVNT